jgi:hypothetical protein
MALAKNGSVGVAKRGGADFTWIEPPMLSPPTLTGVIPE